MTMRRNVFSYSQQPNTKESRKITQISISFHTWVINLVEPFISSILEQKKWWHFSTRTNFLRLFFFFLSYVSEFRHRDRKKTCFKMIFSTFQTFLKMMSKKKKLHQLMAKISKKSACLGVRLITNLLQLKTL